MFFSVYLTIYRSAKSQPSPPLGDELISCSISDFTRLAKAVLSLLKFPLHKTHTKDPSISLFALT